MKKTLSLILAALLTAITLAGCGRAQDNAPDKTTSGEKTESTAETTAAESGENTSAETTAANPVVISTKMLTNSEFGLNVHTADSSKPDIVGTVVSKLGVKLQAYADGDATVKILDCFGHTASVDVSVKGGEISFTAHKTTDKFVEVKTHYGARGDNVTDDTAAIQRALDEAKPGDTVYVYPGIYRVSLLVMREGVTLEMYTTMTDAHTGYTTELSRRIARGEITVLTGVRIMNNGDKMPGRDGASNFTVRGGVLDMQETTRGAIIWGCANNALLENVILRNVKNNHAIQLTGCKNTTVRNCMFAGYTWGGTFTREVLQVEPSTPGATGAVPNSPLSFEEGEYNYPENITITHCYFGKSDTCGAPIMAIGHHSRAGNTANVTNFKITDNIFDEVLYAAIRYNSIVDTEISGNTFISTSKYMNVNDPSATTPAFIVLYSNTGTTKYTSIVSGKSITAALETEHAGVRGLNIVNNTFNIGAGSDKMVIYATGTEYTPGLIYNSSGFFRQDAYNTDTYGFTGYTECTNYMGDFLFANNEINITGQPKYSNFFMYFQRIRGLTVENNTINLAPGVSILRSTDGVIGLSTRGCTMGTHPTQYHIATGTSKTATLEGADPIKIMSGGSYNVVINVEGEGKLIFTASKDGNAKVTPLADVGYRFDGWYDADGTTQVKSNILLSAGLRLTAKFTKIG